MVVVQGARQVRKTTLVNQVVEGTGDLLTTMDDDVAREAATADHRPGRFLVTGPEAGVAATMGVTTGRISQIEAGDICGL